jgi:hypothetical protein
MRLMKAFCQDERLFGITNDVLSQALKFTMPLLAIEQFVASVLIAPKQQSSYPGSSSSTAVLGLELYLAGIAVQEIIVVYIFILAILVYKRFRDSEVEFSNVKTTAASSKASKRWCSTFYALFFSVAAIWTRIAYRLIELSGVFTGYLLVLMHNEVYFYTLECLPILAAVGVWLVAGSEGLLYQGSLDAVPTGAYTYHEVSGELAEDHVVLVARVESEQ